MGEQLEELVWRAWEKYEGQRHFAGPLVLVIYLDEFARRHGPPMDRADRDVEIALPSGRAAVEAFTIIGEALGIETPCPFEKIFTFIALAGREKAQMIWPAG